VIFHQITARDANVCIGNNRSDPKLGAAGSAKSHPLRTLVGPPRAWTLFGPYAAGQPGPQRTGPQRRINSLAFCGPQRNARNQLEVLIF